MDIKLTYPARLKKERDGGYLVSFPDLPEALTDGANLQDALAEASDCLSTALASRISDREDIPTPSPVKRGQRDIAPDPQVALKVAIYRAMREGDDISIAELARRLQLDHKDARRLLDPRHATRLSRMTEALQALGYRVAVNVYPD